MSIDAMKQALEALERGETKLRYQAITALRAAIEQVQGLADKVPARGTLLEQTLGKVWDEMPHPDYQKEMEREPVAWMHNYIEDNVITHRPADLDRHPDRWEALYKTPPPCPTCEALARTVMMDQTSHDVFRNQWQGLTDAELAEFSEAKLGAYDLCLEVEAKLKEKNT